ncbi:MAG TPA: tripartite tricarboxylate transporter substrate binding protein [Ramlibacter sp.]|nr:tripartite tricarboxylate transporter substrate binding protein [Ramlibacter sp.]
MRQPPTLSRRTLLAAAPALLAAPAFAQNFPARPVTLICPFTTGGTADVQLRVLAAAASRELGQPIVVETRAGAAGTLGPASLVGQSPDGHLLSMATGVALLRQPFLQPTRYDPAKNFSYISGVTRFELGLAVRADAPWRNLAEFVADAKKQPGKFSYATAGAATAQHTAMLQLCDAAGIDCVHVPYKGSGDVFNALGGGHVQAISETSGWAPFVDAGKFRLLAVYSEKRLKRWPNAPTLREQGFDIADAVPWGIVGPAGMEARIVERLRGAFHKALGDQAFLKTLEQLGQEPWDLDPKAYREYMLSRIPVERELVAKYRLKDRT